MERLQKHVNLVKDKNAKYRSKYYGFKVTTKQEQHILFHRIKKSKKRMKMNSK